MQAILGVLPNLAAKVTSLSDVYNNVVFLPENTPEQILEKLSSDSCFFRDPLEASAAISAVAKATFNLESLFSSVGADSVKSLTAEDLASARMLLPTIRNAFEKATSAVNERARHGTSVRAPVSKGDQDLGACQAISPGASSGNWSVCWTRSSGIPSAAPSSCRCSPGCTGTWRSPCPIPPCTAFAAAGGRICAFRPRR